MYEKKEELSLGGVIIALGNNYSGLNHRYNNYIFRLEHEYAIS